MRFERKKSFYSSHPCPFLAVGSTREYYRLPEKDKGPGRNRPPTARAKRADLKANRGEGEAIRLFGFWAVPGGAWCAGVAQPLTDDQAVDFLRSSGRHYQSSKQADLRGEGGASGN